MATYFKNLTVKLHVLYILKTHVKFHVNQILFINFMYNFRLQNSKYKHLIDDIVIDL